MKYLNLGPIEEFPFIEPPDTRQIRDGYHTLRELNALDEQNELTNIGRALARFPVDPRIGRMILDSIEEDCLDEMLIIAAALSVQDPRDRPMDQQDAADQAHGK
jgi:ATP-dependent helicase HrpA